MSDKARIGVVGAGTMGRGIVQLFAQSCHPVSVFDSFDGAVPKAIASINAMIDKLVSKSKLSADQGEAVKNRIKPCTAMSELSDCDIVIEAIIEEVGAKQQLFAQLEEILSSSAILASNTSSLVVADIASACKHPERVAGLHFFNPVPLMRVVEIIAAVRTSDETVATLKEAVDGTGHRAVIAADQPGFLVNHAGRGYYTEALRVLEEQVASTAQIDAVMRDAAGFRMGPFELLDLTGLDVSGKVMESIYSQFHQEPRFRPSSLVPPRIAAGLFGRKTSMGWYRYDEKSKPVDASVEQAIPALPSGLKVHLAPDCARNTALKTLVSSADAQLADNAKEADLILIQPWGWDATAASVRAGLDASKIVAIDPLPEFARRRTLMLSAVTTPAARDAALALLSSDGTPVTLIGDSPGFITQRVLATIVNIAANIAQRGIASVDDIEDAVKLGLGYPQGPLHWGDQIGGERVLKILRVMQELTGDPRYRPSPWLERRVRLGLSLLTPEAAR